LRFLGDAKFDDLANKRYIDRQGICAELNPNYNGSDYCPTALGYENGVLEDIESIERTDTIALAAVIGGATSALVSIYLFVTGEDPGRYEAYGASGTTASVSIGPGGVSVGGRF
jgi:hypothetical protein